MHSVATKCFSCNIIAPMLAVASGWQCQTPGCYRVYKSAYYKIKGESKNGRRQRLASRVELRPQETKERVAQECEAREEIHAFV